MPMLAANMPRSIHCKRRPASLISCLARTAHTTITVTYTTMTTSWIAIPASIMLQKKRNADQLPSCTSAALPQSRSDQSALGRNPLAASLDLVGVSPHRATGHPASDGLDDERDDVGRDKERLERLAGEETPVRRDMRDRESRRPVQRRRVKRGRNHEAADLASPGQGGDGDRSGFLRVSVVTSLAETAWGRTCIT